MIPDEKNLEAIVRNERERWNNNCPNMLRHDDEGIVEFNEKCKEHI